MTPPSGLGLEALPVLGLAGVEPGERERASPRTPPGHRVEELLAFSGRTQRAGHPVPLPVRRKSRCCESRGGDRVGVSHAQRGRSARPSRGPPGRRAPVPARCRNRSNASICAPTCPEGRAAVAEAREGPAPRHGAPRSPGLGERRATCRRSRGSRGTQRRDEVGGSAERPRDMRTLDALRPQLGHEEAPYPEASWSPVQSRLGAGDASPNRRLGGVANAAACKAVYTGSIPVGASQ